MTDPNASGEEDEAVHIIGGRRYRHGFIRAQWHLLDESLGAGARRRLAMRENVLDQADDLYHYTTLAGLQGIVLSKGFWASDNRFMNDSEEIQHGVNLAEAVATHRSCRTNASGFSDVLAAVAEELSKPQKVGRLVACFSTAKDSLEQWRGYGPSGAVCLRLKQGVEKSRPLFVGPDLMPHKVLYDWRAKVTLLFSKIRRYEAEYRIDREVMSDHWPDDYDQEYVRSLSGELFWGAVGFKNPAFRQEAEVRMTIDFDHADRFGKLEFRPTPLGLVPYINTSKYIDGGRLPISEVIVGPSPRQELVAASVRTFLDEDDHSDAAVTLSKVPYRSF